MFKMFSISLFILILCFVIIRLRKRRKVLKKINFESKIEIQNLALSIGKSKELYKRLITQVHPDKFENNFKKEAENLASEITKNKKNYNALKELAENVNSFLKYAKKI